jgi:hypothetical protein
MITFNEFEDNPYPYYFSIMGDDLTRLTYYNFGTHFKSNVKEWFEENIAYEQWDYIDGGLSWFDVCFKNKADAMLFKTTWF